MCEHAVHAECCMLCPVMIAQSVSFSFLCFAVVCCYSTKVMQLTYGDAKTVDAKVSQT